MSFYPWCQIAHPLPDADVLASIEGLAYPADPGGPLTATRLAIVRRLAATDHHAPHAQALLDALDEVESLRAERDEHHADAALTARLLAEVPGSAEWPPAWLRELVETGHSDAVQADRAMVTSTANLGQVPSVAWRPGTAWYRHAEAPRDHDAAAYAIACRVLAACEGRRE